MQEGSIFRTKRGYERFMAAYDTALSLWPVPYKDYHVPTSYGSTYVIESGPEDAPPLVLLPGAGTSSSIWLLNVGDLSRRFRTLAIDIPGDAGRSGPAPGRPMYGRADYAAWMAEVLDALGVGKAHIAGLSYGAWIALATALNMPERVGRLVLVSPAGCFGPFNMRLFWGLVLMRLLPVRPVFHAGLWWLSARGRLARECWIEQMAAAVRDAAPRLAFPDIFTDGELRKVKSPVLVMVGENETVFDWRAAIMRAKRSIPDVDVEVVEGAGHVLIADQTEAADERIIKFLG